MKQKEKQELRTLAYNIQHWAALIIGSESQEERERFCDYLIREGKLLQRKTEG